ncbi:MAG: TonB-dependent receptor [Verrucomicrobia bacterium]|nr:TonB-dependent receptor [Verrucomicrobiota bacterium]
MAPLATTYTGIDARLYGLQFNGRVQVMDSLIVSGGLAWQRGQLNRNNPTNQRNMAEVPPMRAQGFVAWRQNRLTAQLIALHQSKLNRVDPTVTERPLPGWTTFNLLGSYQFNANFLLSAGVDNLFDRTYAVANSFIRDPFSAGNVVNEPGRSFMHARAFFLKKRQ